MPEGQGVSWAEVTALPAAEVARSHEDLLRLSTDETGRFRLSGLYASATYDLMVQADGFATAHRVVRVSETDDLEIVLDAGHTLIGRLVSRNGGAVAGAEIAVAPTAEGWARLQYSLRPDSPPWCSPPGAMRRVAFGSRTSLEVPAGVWWRRRRGSR